MSTSTRLHATLRSLVRALRSQYVRPPRRRHAAVSTLPQILESRMLLTTTANVIDVPADGTVEGEIDSNEDATVFRFVAPVTGFVFIDRLAAPVAELNDSLNVEIRNSAGEVIQQVQLSEPGTDPFQPLNFVDVTAGDVLLIRVTAPTATGAFAIGVTTSTDLSPLFDGAITTSSGPSTDLLPPGLFPGFPFGPGIPQPLSVTAPPVSSPPPVWVTPPVLSPPPVLTLPPASTPPAASPPLAPVDPPVSTPSPNSTLPPASSLPAVSAPQPVPVSPPVSSPPSASTLPQTSSAAVVASPAADSTLPQMSFPSPGPAASSSKVSAPASSAVAVTTNQISPQPGTAAPVLASSSPSGAAAEPGTTSVVNNSPGTQISPSSTVQADGGSTSDGAVAGLASIVIPQRGNLLPPTVVSDPPISNQPSGAAVPDQPGLNRTIR